MSNEKKNWKVGDVAVRQKSTSQGRAGEMRLILEDRGTHFVFTHDINTTRDVLVVTSEGTPDPLMQGECWMKLDFTQTYDRLLKATLEEGVLVDTDFRGNQVVINSRALAAEKEVIELNREIARLKQQITGSVAPGKCLLPGQCATFGDVPTVALMESSMTQAPSL
jgi:hypothetical protein